VKECKHDACPRPDFWPHTNLVPIETLSPAPVCSQTCDCCWLLSFRELLPAMLRQLAAAPREARRLPALLAAFVDGGSLLAHAASPTERQLEVRRHCCCVRLPCLLGMKRQRNVVDNWHLRLEMSQCCSRPLSGCQLNEKLSQHRYQRGTPAVHEPVASSHYRRL